MEAIPWLSLGICWIASKLDGMERDRKDCRQDRERYIDEGRAQPCNTRSE